MVELTILSFIRVSLKIAMLRLVAWLFLNEIREGIKKEIKEDIENEFTRVFKRK